MSADSFDVAWLSEALKRVEAERDELKDKIETIRQRGGPLLVLLMAEFEFSGESDSMSEYACKVIRSQRDTITQLEKRLALVPPTYGEKLSALRKAVLDARSNK